LRVNENLSACLVKGLKFDITTGLLANRSLVFDVLKAWYIDWLPVRNSQAKKKEKKEYVILKDGSRRKDGSFEGESDEWGERVENVLFGKYPFVKLSSSLWQNYPYALP